MFKIKLKKRESILFLNENPVVKLQHTNGRNAEWQITIKKSELKSGEKEYHLIVAYGKIGSHLTTQKIETFDTITKAEVYFNKKIKEKKAKGYEIISSKL